MKCGECNTEYDGPSCPTCVTIATTGEQALTAKKAIDISAHFSAENCAPAVFQQLGAKRNVPISFPVCRIGRDQANEIVISGDDRVSRVHCVICAEGGYFFVADAGSKNGTYLNGNELLERTTLTDGDRLQIGRVELRFIHDRSASSGPLAGEDYRLFLAMMQRRLRLESLNLPGGESKETAEFKLDDFQRD